jgi:hypothetical protein
MAIFMVARTWPWAAAFGRHKNAAKRPDKSEGGRGLGLACQGQQGQGNNKGGGLEHEIS